MSRCSHVSSIKTCAVACKYIKNKEKKLAYLIKIGRKSKVNSIVDNHYYDAFCLISFFFSLKKIRKTRKRSNIEEY